MKTRLIPTLAALLCSAALASFNTGCTTNAVVGAEIAGGEAALGDAYANAKLSSIDGSPAGTVAQQQAVSDLKRLGVDLQAFVAGKLTQFELGALQAQLKKDQIAFGGNATVTADITSILNIFAQNVGASAANGLVAPSLSLAQGNVANIVYGINASLQLQTGKWSVTNPGVWTAPAPGATTS